MKAPSGLRSLFQQSLQIVDELDLDAVALHDDRLLDDRQRVFQAQ